MATTPGADALNGDLDDITSDLSGWVLKQGTLVKKVLQNDPKEDILKLFNEMFDTKKRS